MLLLALWVPVTMHCTLENVPGFSFFQYCCGGDETPPVPGDCEDDTCGTVESGLYKLEEDPAITPALTSLLVVVAWNSVTEPPADTAPLFASSSPAPPELPKVWQFFHRTALPPRAPSVAA